MLVLIYVIQTLKTIYPRGKDKHKSCTAHHGEPLLCPCLRTTCNFLVIFLGWVLLLYPQATSTDHGGPRTSDLSIERRRPNQFTTAPQKSQFQNSITKISIPSRAKFPNEKFPPFISQKMRHICLPSLKISRLDCKSCLLEKWLTNLLFLSNE